MKTYLVEYTAYNSANEQLKHGKMKVHNCTSEFVAKCKLDGYLKRTLLGFNRLVVHSCKEHNIMTDFFNGGFEWPF